MDKLSIISLSVLLIAIVAAGCDSSGNTQNGGPGSPYIGGTYGMIANFESFGVLENNIPTIFEGETFPVEVTLKNKGEEPIEAGTAQINIVGIAATDYTGIDLEKTNINILEKVSDINPTGGEETVDFGDAQYAHDIKTSFYDAKIFAQYQYPYATHVTVPQVCFKEDTQDTTICTAEEKKTSYSSGAPIAVTNVEEKRAGAGIIALEYTVDNIGGGEVAAPDKDFDVRYGTIAFSLDESANPGDWECKMGGQENGGRLTDNKGVIRCKLLQPMEENTLYTKQIDMTISYKYRNLIQQDIRIKNKEE